MAEAAASLRAAVAALERVGAIERERAALSWRWKAAVCALVFVAGVAVASAGWVALARSGVVSPPYLPATAAGCVAAGGGVAKDANGRTYCAFFVSP